MELVEQAFRLSEILECKMASAFMLAHPYGTSRVMSSYFWEQDFQGGTDKNDWVGLPNTNGNTDDVSINPDMSCGGGWICEHRWAHIYNMVKFRNVALNEALTNWSWDNGNNQISFSRGNKGFIAINNDADQLSASFQTGLPAGSYCDVISGGLENGKCNGKTITVGEDGTAQITISNMDEDPVFAIHAESKL